MADQSTPAQEAGSDTGGNPEAQAAQLVTQIQTQTPATEEGQGAGNAEPNLPEGFDPTAFNQQLQQVAGIEDYTQIPVMRDNLQALQGQYEQVNTRFNQVRGEYEKLKADAQLSPYANPFVEQLNQRFKANEDPQVINKWAALHFMDIEGMGPQEAYVTKLRMDNPTWQDSHINRHMDKAFGTLPDKEDEGYDAAVQQRNLDIEMEGAKAKGWLNEQLTDFSDPQRQEQIQQRNQAVERYTAAWDSVAKQLVTDVGKIDYELDDKAIGGKFEFAGYQPKLNEAEKADLNKMLVEYAVQRNLPLTQESLPELVKHRQDLIWHNYRDDIMKHIMADYHASLQEFFVKTYAGGGAPPKGSEASKNPPAKSTTAAAEARKGNVQGGGLPKLNTYKNSDQFV